jgi:hypothetical protein
VPRRRKNRSYKTFDVPVPEAEPLEKVLATKLGSAAKATAAMHELAAELNLRPGSPEPVLAALALARLGLDIDRIAESLDWKDFEDLCAAAMVAAGYRVTKNVRLRKPTRQIDIVAESTDFALVVDCKHWRRSVGAAGIGPVALAQAERASLLERSLPGKAALPVILTMVDNRVRFVRGVAVVPVVALRDFLSSVSRFDEGFALPRD